MKEYVSETGGRYTYTDDILNLQELALSMTSIFSACSNFIIAGCEVAGNEISEGYVWINGKVRAFEGCKNAVFPYYIYEKNTSDSVTYANEVNKRGRDNYLCVGSSTKPTLPDEHTKSVPQFIEVGVDYSPRLIDKFFGKYALLLDTPFSKQTVKKDLVLSGNISVEKNIESKTAISIMNPENGYSLKNVVKASGDGSVGLYLNGLLVNEIIINTDGSFSFVKQDKVIAKISDGNVEFVALSSSSIKAGSILISENRLANISDNTDSGSIDINASGFEDGLTRFRNFNVFDGKQKKSAILQIIGKTGEAIINGIFKTKTAGTGITLSNTNHLKSDPLLTNAIIWEDSAIEKIAVVGYDTNNSFDFSIKNLIGNIIISPKEYVNIIGDLKINGVSVGTTYVSETKFTEALKKKVDVVQGKQLSTEDFTSDYKKKLDQISSGNLEGGGNGFVSASDVNEALKKKLTVSSNLSDVPDKGAARTNLEVYSKSETDRTYLKISNKLSELVSLTADEINGLTPEQAASLKAQKQEAVRNNIDAEKKGVGTLKLDKSKNLSDLSDKGTARKNISVYSTTEIDNLLSKKLDSDKAYNGADFTEEMKDKLNNIKGGSFAYTDADGTSHAQVEGFVSTSQVVKELNKKANILLDGYNSSQKETIASNIGVYSISGADKKFAALSTSFQDYITYLIQQGNSEANAKKVLRDKLDCPSKSDVSSNYIRKDGKLSDLSLPNADAKKLACSAIGAAYANDYQTKISDTGWLQMGNSGNSTDTKNLFVRQIGNIVCIQGTVNTSKRDGDTVAILPNQIQAPKYSVKHSVPSDFNDDVKYNRGSSFTIHGNTRKIVIQESGNYNVDVVVNFTYMV